MKIAIVSLGCPKNQVDADVFCRALLDAGHKTTPFAAEADAIIVNTCGFIQAAKEEAIEAVFDACTMKKERPELIVMVTGCLPERYQREVAAEIPELDAVVGIGANGRIPRILAELENRNSNAVRMGRGKATPLECFGPKKDLNISAPRVISTPVHYAWLKVAEGCSNACSYCAIPQIRGPQRSRTIADCVQEARWLAAQGVRELVLVAQDTTAFGRDRKEGETLAGLLEELNGIDDLAWIRILYAYPECVDETLLRAMQQNKKVLHYLDLPVQHINNDILASMRRKGNAEVIERALQLTRKVLPDVTLRTSLIAGYPGESEEQFEELCAFVKRAQFDRLGCFAYSPEEGTAAARLPGQLPREERLRRSEIIMRIQNEVMQQKQRGYVGRQVRAICDGPDSWRQKTWRLRGPQDAPEIDTDILVESQVPLQAGVFYNLKILALEEDQLIGAVVP